MRGRRRRRRCGAARRLFLHRPLTPASLRSAGSAAGRTLSPQAGRGESAPLSESFASSRDEGRGMGRTLRVRLDRSFRKSAVSASRSSPPSGASVSCVTRCAAARASSAARRPCGVSATTTRRASSGSALVSVRRRFVRRSMTPLIVAASIAVRRPRRFCEHGPVSRSFAIAAHCVGVTSGPICAEKIAAWRWLTWRRRKPTCC